VTNHRANAGRRPQKDRGVDLYETPAPATRALLHLEREHLPRRILEPACGRGAIARELEAAGFEVRSSDLADYGYPGAVSGLDFLSVGREHLILRDIDAIITNAPFYLCSHSAPFVRHVVDLAPYAALLLRLPFLEGHRRQRRELTSAISRVYVASRRLPMMHRDGWNGPRADSSTAYAWFVWDRRRQGSRRFDHFDWRDFASAEEIRQIKEQRRSERGRP
jgi:hypothetical protein